MTGDVETSVPILTGAQLALAFDGQLEPVKTTWKYRLSVLAVFLAMILLPVVYVGIIAAAIVGIWWYAVHAAAMFEHVPAGRLWLAVAAIYIAPLIAVSLLVLFMILPIFWRSRKTEKPYWVDRREQPLLYAYIDLLCDTMRAPRPVRIDVTAAANASAHIDNGMFGLLNRKLVLTIGLPFPQTMNLRHFTGVLAHEMGHFSQGGFMRLSYASQGINRWFFRMAYTRSGADDLARSLSSNGGHWTISLIGAFSALVLLITRLVLKGMALASHAIAMHLSRQAEFDADRRAARIVGGTAMGDALEIVPYIDAAGDIAFKRAAAGWAKRSLPDDLTLLTAAFHQKMPADVQNKITAMLLAQDARWMDTHPPLFKRIAEMRTSGIKGVLKLDAPASCLFRDFDELRKLSTIRHYQAALGAKLEAEHIVPIDLNEIFIPRKKPVR